MLAYEKHFIDKGFESEGARSLAENALHACKAKVSNDLKQARWPQHKTNVVTWETCFRLTAAKKTNGDLRKLLSRDEAMRTAVDLLDRGFTVGEQKLTDAMDKMEESKRHEYIKRLASVAFNKSENWLRIPGKAPRGQSSWKQHQLNPDFLDEMIQVFMEVNHVLTYVHTYVRTYVRTYINTYVSKFVRTYIGR